MIVVLSFCCAKFLCASKKRLSVFLTNMVVDVFDMGKESDRAVLKSVKKRKKGQFQMGIAPVGSV